MSYALEIENVSKKYNDFLALDNINFKIKQGDFVGLLGVNGAGKTSLIFSIAGINKFTGKIRVMGYDVVEDEIKAKLSMGIVPQEVAIDSFLTVYQTLKIQSGLYHVKNNKKWIDEILERLSLTDKKNTNTRALSGGMKRRLMVAQALVHKPPLIILDEPTAGVDVEIRKNFWDFITDLNKQGHTILLTTHYLEEVEKLCQKIIILNKGKTGKQQTKYEFMNQSIGFDKTLQLTLVDAAMPSELGKRVLNQQDNTYTLELASDADILDILTTLKLQNIKIENIEINRQSLEDVFMQHLSR
jgi:ABC-2 type transport system ATP-binding protein